MQQQNRLKTETYRQIQSSEAATVAAAKAKTFTRLNGQRERTAQTAPPRKVVLRRSPVANGVIKPLQQKQEH